MRSILFIVLFCLVAGNFVCLAAGVDMLALYQETGAALLETEFQAWLLLAPEYNQVPVAKLLAEIAGEFGYELTGSIEESSFQERFEQAFALVNLSGAAGWLTVQRLPNYPLASGSETYLGLRAVRQGAWPDLAAYRERATTEFGRFGRKTDLQFFTTLIGTRGGKLSKDEREEIVGRVRSLAEAELLETFSEGELTTYAFVSPHLPDLLQVGARQMNLHLAFRYNEFENQTYIYLGNPIIAPDY